MAHTYRLNENGEVEKVAQTESVEILDEATLSSRIERVDEEITNLQSRKAELEADLAEVQALKNS